MGFVLWYPSCSEASRFKRVSTFSTNSTGDLQATALRSWLSWINPPCHGWLWPDRPQSYHCQQLPNAYILHWHPFNVFSLLLTKYRKESIRITKPSSLEIIKRKYQNKKTLFPQDPRSTMNPRRTATVNNIWLQHSEITYKMQTPFTIKYMYILQYVF